jgi:hypothetical protein
MFIYPIDTTNSETPLFVSARKEVKQREKERKKAKEAAKKDKDKEKVYMWVCL